MNERDLVHEAHVAAAHAPVLAPLLVRLANQIQAQAREITALREIVKEDE